MDYQSTEKVYDYSYLSKYGQRSYGFGVKAPVFSVYKYGTQFEKNTKPVPLCSNAAMSNIDQSFYGDIPYEFNRMIKQKTII